MPPAFIAFLILCFSGILTFITQAVFDFGLNLILPNGCVFLMQGLIAAGLARLLKMQAWWPYILAAFPLAVWLGLILHINPLFYFVGFVLFASLYWSVFLTQVPYYPSSRAVCLEVAEILPPDQQRYIAEIGSGLGGFSLQLSKLRPKVTILGMEIAPLPWLISYLRAKFQKSSVRFQLGNYRSLDFARFDLIFAYLSPAAMPDLYKQCQEQMKSGGILVSHEFAVPNIEPSKTLQSGSNNKITYIFEIACQ